MVCNHSHRVACPLEIVLSFHESVYYSKELSIEDVVILFYSRKSFEEEGTRV